MLRSRPHIRELGNAAGRGASIGLDPGDDVHCTFTVAGPGKLLISVRTDPPGGQPPGQDATLDFVLDGRVGGQSRSVSVGETLEFDKLPAGQYVARVVVSQTKWKLVAVDCDETKPETPSTGDVAGRLATVGVDGGDEVTCTFTLGEPGDVNITLVSDPPGSDTKLPFFFASAGSSGVAMGNELVVGSTWKLEDIPVGGYLADTPQTGGPLRWRLLDVSCVETEAKTTSEGDLPDRAARIGIDPADVVDCTFTVAGPGTVKVTLDTDLPGADGSLDFFVVGRNQSIRPSRKLKVGYGYRPD